MRRSILFALVVAVAACATTEDGPSDEELAALDGWATTTDGKADLPPSMAAVIAWLRDVYINKMSAVWHDQEHPRTAAAALDRIRGILTRAGIDPERTLYRTTVQRLIAEVHHSEINIGLPTGTVVRLVGDPKGAGVFFDHERFEQTIGPELCLTWSELETAVKTSYVFGAYGFNFVCHTVTERVLRALDVGTHRYAAQVFTYPSARWSWGPSFPSFNSHDPADWEVSRVCL